MSAAQDKESERLEREERKLRRQIAAVEPKISVHRAEQSPSTLAELLVLLGWKSSRELRPLIVWWVANARDEAEANTGLIKSVNGALGRDKGAASFPWFTSDDVRILVELKERRASAGRSAGAKAANAIRAAKTRQD